MTEPLGVDTEGLARSAPEFRALAMRINAVAASLTSALREHGAPWGDDSSGRSFEQGYGPMSKQIASGFHSVGEVVGSTADGVETMAGGFGRTEEGNLDAAQSIANQVGNAGGGAHGAPHTRT